MKSHSVSSGFPNGVALTTAEYCVQSVFEAGCIADIEGDVLLYVDVLSRLAIHRIPDEGHCRNIAFFRFVDAGARDSQRVLGILSQFTA